MGEGKTAETREAYNKAKKFAKRAVAKAMKNESDRVLSDLEADKNSNKFQNCEADCKG